MSALWMGVLAHLWQTTLVLALVAVLALLLRRAPARYQEGLWTAGLLKLLVPLPLLAAFWPTLRRLASSAGQQDTIGPAIKTLSAFANPEMLWVQPAASGDGGLSPVVFVVATGLWTLGATVLLAVWWRRGRIAMPVGDEPWHAQDDIVERVSHAARAANVPLSRIRITDASVVPCVRNLRKPLVVLSKAVIEHLGADELRAVLIHENAHRQRGDLWRSAAQRVSTCIFFFYPPAWWLTRRLRESAEMTCDEAVLAAGIDPRTYARALARTVDLELASSAAPALGRGGTHLRARLQRIKDPERYAIMNRHRFAVVAAFIAAVGLSFIPVADGAGLAAAVGAEQESSEWVPAARLSGLKGLDTAVELNYQDAALAQVLEDLGTRAGFDVYFMSQEGAPMPVGGEIQEPQRIHYVAPVYPDEARRAGTSGTVVLQAVIGKEGNVKKVEVSRGLDPGLDSAAVAAVKQWKYAPTRYDGEAVEVIVTITVIFRLAQ